MKYIALFFTWIEERLVGFTASDLSEEGEDAEEFKFWAKDIGDVVNFALYRFDMTSEILSFFQ